ncbi:MAG: Ig-like domain-containing protein [Acidimicrobiales bacterium]
MFTVSILLASLVLMGSGVMASGAASASPSGPCYPIGSTTCPGKLTATPSIAVPGELVRIIGKGFKAGAKVIINVCNLDDTVITHANDGGSPGWINVLITIPGNARLGACKFTATGLGANDQTLTLTTTVLVKLASKTVLKLSHSKVTYGDEEAEQLSVKVSPQNSNTTAYGSVTIKESTTTLCTFTLSSGKGSCVLSARRLGVGTYYLVAIYGGSTRVASSTSVKEPFTVAKVVSKTALKLSHSKVTYGDEQAEHLSVTVLPELAGLTPYGSVTIKESTTTLCTFTLSSGKGSCVLSARRLGIGTYYLVAIYGGSAEVKSSTSVKETLTVAKATSKTVLKLSSSKVNYGNEEVEHLSVTVLPEFAGATPYGRVTIEGSATPLCTFTLSSGKGSCVLTANKFVPGVYNIVAIYSGSKIFKSSISAKETLTVGD